MADETVIFAGVRVTPRQEAVLLAIESAWREHGYGPTTREICQAIGVSSTYAVHCLLAPLRAKGLVFDEIKPRTLRTQRLRIRAGAGGMFVFWGR